MIKWLYSYTLPDSENATERRAAVNRLFWPTEKPNATISLDDRCLQFTGAWPPVETLLTFKPWNKK
jgi:hypothetical protein